MSINRLKASYGDTWKIRSGNLKARQVDALNAVHHCYKVYREFPSDHTLLTLGEAVAMAKDAGLRVDNASGFYFDVNTTAILTLEGFL